SRPDAAQFRDVAFRAEVTGSPILEGTLGWLDCRVEAIHVAGDHDIVVGEVLGMGVGPAEQPLVYYASDYHRLED
ncbi:MAG: flavin reductase family protein, partial [Ilumatobacteraceae bacterium]